MASEIEGLGETHILTLFVKETAVSYEILHMADELEDGNYHNLGRSQ